MLLRKRSLSLSLWRWKAAPTLPNRHPSRRGKGDEVVLVLLGLALVVELALLGLVLAPVLLLACLLLLPRQ